MGLLFAVYVIIGVMMFIMTDFNEPQSVVNFIGFTICAVFALTV